MAHLSSFSYAHCKKDTIHLELSAAEILQKNYDLNDFNAFHAEMIRKAGTGKLFDFLKLSDLGSIPIFDRQTPLFEN